MIGYVTIGTNDIDKARTFYDALFGSVGAKRLMELPSGFTMYGNGFGVTAVGVTPAYNGEPPTAGNGNMVSLVFMERAQVDALHAKALELGGSDEGPPG